MEDELVAREELDGELVEELDEAEEELALTVALADDVELDESGPVELSRDWVDPPSGSNEKSRLTARHACNKDRQPTPATVTRAVALLKRNTTINQV